MAVSKAQQASVHKYVKNHYDRINLTVPKGRRDEIKAVADAHGISLNSFVVQAIDEKMDREAHTSPVDAQGGGVVSVPMESREDATGRE